MYADPKSKISQLEKVLDAREDLVSKKVKRHELSDRESTINQDWTEPTVVGAEISSIVPEKIGISLPIKILLGSIIFFIIAVLVVLFGFLGGGNIVSGDNIEINVRAPISIAGGELLPFEIEIINNNNVKLLGVDLGVTFPDGARQANDTSLSAKRVQEYLGDISQGAHLKKNLSVVLFGSENEEKEIIIALEYKVPGSNSLFNKTKTVSILLNSSPVSLVVTAPKEVNTNQAVDVTVEITSNSPTVLKNLLLTAEYPFGFTFSRSEPNFSSKNNVWLIGDLEPGAKRTLKISGLLNGQEGEERGFNFSIGTQSKTDKLKTDVPFNTSFSSITIRRPFVSADVFFNGENSSEYVSTAGEKVEVIIKWQNNLAYQVSDVSLAVKMSGNILNKASVRAEEGFYRSVDNTVIFNQSTDPNLKILDPGDSGESKFVFESFGINSVTGSGLSNPIINFTISVEGQRVDYGSNQAEDVLFSDTRKVKIASAPQVFAKALYYIGPFQNTGLIPPKAETESTYTITWTVTNPLNGLSGVRVSTVLPPYIKWLDTVSPASEKFSFNETTRELIWSVGNVSSGAGTISPAREASFKISFLPSVDQIGQSPNLVGNLKLEAKDTFTGTATDGSFGAVTTSLTNDPYFRIGQEKVVQ
ncbi:MAG: hypothetical protein WC027_02665 [Candidatus Paceibacterota bacterium]